RAITGFTLAARMDGIGNVELRRGSRFQSGILHVADNADDGLPRRARIGIAGLQALAHAAKAIQEPDRFTLGYSPDINPALLSKLLSIPAQLWKLTFQSVFISEQVDLIQAGELDAGLVILPIPDESLEVERVLYEPCRNSRERDRRFAGSAIWSGQHLRRLEDPLRRSEPSGAVNG